MDEERDWLTEVRSSDMADTISMEDQEVRLEENRMHRMTWVDGSNVTITRWIFLRFLSFIFLVAFVSFWRQADGLVGDQGILPVHQTLRQIEQAVPEVRGSVIAKLTRFPTLCWWGGDDMVRMCCWVGACSSLLAMSGVAAPICFFMMWACYLSLCTVGQIFMGYQWDILLLESGFLAIFFAPWQLIPRISKEPPPSLIILIGYRWLVVRLMLASAIVKVASGDPTWWPDLTAMTFHYQTQPIPPWTAWYVHHLPVTFQKVSTAAVLLIELVLPLMIPWSRRLRWFACGGLIVLQLLILITGNYTFFNWLSIALCLLLLDDRILPIKWIKKRVKGDDMVRPAAWRWMNRACCLALLGCVLSVSVPSFLRQVDRLFTRFGPSYGFEGPNWLIELERLVAPFRSIGTYGLFAVMTQDRPEILIEGSSDGVEWKPYEFVFKPGALNRRPPFVAPHQPRLDWQMWFAALGSIHNRRTQAWFVPFLERLLQGSEAVEAMFDQVPFPDDPPRFLRAQVYAYEFTDSAERRETGNWWRRGEPRVYCPPVSLSHIQRKP